jgi:hypothetical protein
LLDRSAQLDDQIEDGDEYSVCSACGTIRDPAGKPIDESNVTWSKRSTADRPE